MDNNDDLPKKISDPHAINAEEITEFSYQGRPVTRRGDLLNLTSMWAAAGRPETIKPYNWLQFPETKTLFAQFREELLHLPSDVKGMRHMPFSDDPETWIIKKRGRTGGTWLYWDLAISYARSLSPAFHLWTNRIVRPHMERFGGPRDVDMVIGNSPYAGTTKLVKLLEREFGSLHQRHDDHDRTLHALDQNDADMLHFLRTMPRVLHAERRPFSKSAKLIMIKVISMPPYNGQCPCCRENPVLTDGRVAEGAEFDHWYDSAMALPVDGWLICKPCHSEISNNHVAAHARSRAFHLFQAAIIANEQVLAVLRRSRT
jgi:hypothetical protein